MKKQLNYYKFEKISTTMAKEFGTIKRGSEGEHEFMLFAMEGNLLKLHRQNEKRNGRRAIEAIHTCLLMVDGYLNDFEYDISEYFTDENKDFVKGLLMSFDPFTNREIMPVVEQIYDLQSPEDLRLYFEEPVMCLLRIEKSIETWMKEMGANGYFLFLEGQIGQAVAKDLEMKYSVYTKG